VGIRLVNLSRDVDPVVDSCIKSGRYANAGEVISSALHLLDREERECEEKLAMLRAAIEEGFASGEAEPGLPARISAYIDQLAAPDKVQEGPWRNIA